MTETAVAGTTAVASVIRPVSCAVPCDIDLRDERAAR
jgi:hypothetical protein